MQENSLPPLSWLRSFEAAGRLLSFKQAASELCVSPSTISHQIRDLEDYLGMPLFVRGKHLCLTEEGRSYLSPVESGFELLRSAEIKFPTDNRFNIGAFPFLANEILTPNMPELRNRVSPRISLYTDTSLESLQRYERSERLDLVVRYSSSGRFPGFVSKKLFNINMVPIISCSADEPSSMEELLAQPRIKVIGPFDGWSQWDRHFNQKPTGPVVLETDSYHAAVLAVERGEGMCLAILPYIQPWISKGRVSSMSQYEFDVDQSAHLVFAHHSRDSPAIANFHSWLCENLSC